MALSIEKAKYFDPRLLPQKARYAVTQGALSVSSSPFQSLSATNSQLSFQISVPSPNVFLDRRLPITSTVYLSLQVQPGATAVVDAPLLVVGEDLTLCAFPLHSLFSVLQVSLGDCQISSNLLQSRDTLLRLMDGHKERRYKTCPVQLDSFARNNDAQRAGATHTSFATLDSALLDEGNATSAELVFVNPNDGRPLQGDGNYSWPVGGVATTFNYFGGVPAVLAGNTAQPVFLRFTSSENLQISPFQWLKDDAEGPGLFGLQTISVIANIQSPSAARVLRVATSRGRVFSNIAFWSPPNSASAFSNARIDATFLTPSLSVPLAPQCIANYFETVAYTSQQSVDVGAGKVVSTQTLSLPAIPDFICLSVQPSTYAQSDATWFVPITGVSLNWSNYSGLLSSLGPTQLYRMSAENGLDMSWNVYRGSARTMVTGAVPSSAIVQTVSGPLVLRPGKDISLSDGEAPGVSGQFTFNATLTLDNSFAAAALPCTITVLCIYSGFVVISNGQSRTIRGPLNQADVLAAPIQGSLHDVRRMIGAGFADRFGNALSGARDMAEVVAHKVKQEIPKIGRAVAAAASDLAHRIM